MVGAWGDMKHPRKCRHGEPRLRQVIVCLWPLPSPKAYIDRFGHCNCNTVAYLASPKTTKLIGKIIIKLIKYIQIQ